MMASGQTVLARLPVVASSFAFSLASFRASFLPASLATLALTGVLAGMLAALLPAPAYGQSDPIRFIDDAGQALQLQTPARRIVALAPHITEMLFFVGAGAQVVGVAQASDFPAEVARLPVVASHNDINLEAVVRLKPDAVIAWGRGAANPKLDRLKSMGLRVVYSDPQTPAGIAENMQWMAQMAGTEVQAQPAIDAWRSRLMQIESQHASPGHSGAHSVGSVAGNPGGSVGGNTGSPDARPDDPLVFYQVWDKPLMTVNRRHLIAQAIHLCGGRTLFADLALQTPTVSVEAVVRGNPDVILYTDDRKRSLDWGKQWSVWRNVKAVRASHVFSLPPDLIVRPGPRYLDGVERVCDVVNRVKAAR